MNFTLINKNNLIPSSKLYTNIDDVILELKKITFEKKLDYCSNVLITSNNKEKINNILFSNGCNDLYILTNNGIHKYDDYYSQLNENLLNSNTIYDFLHNNEEIEIIPKQNKTQHVQFKENFVIVSNKNIQDEEVKEEEVKEEEVKEVKQEEDNILLECEKMMKIFEENNKRKLLLNEKIKIEKKKEMEIIKKLNDIKQNKIIALKGNYQTFLNIKKISDEKDFKIPEIFEHQYNFYNLLDDEKIKLISDLTDMKILNVYEFDETLIELSNVFNDIVLTNHKTFVHEWSGLENEMVIRDQTI